MDKIIKIFKPIIEKYGFFSLFLIIGLLIFFYPMFSSNFDLMPSNGLKVKYINYVLEHSWLFLKGAELHKSLWDMPFNYPIKNTLALNDTLISIMPLYWLIRAFFKNPFTALQSLLIILCVLNYSSFYYLLKEIKFSKLASSTGAFIFAFSLMRYFKMTDLTVYLQFYTIFAIIFLLKVNKKNSSIKNHLLFLASSVSIVLQFYGSFSMGLLSSLVAFFALVFALLPKTGRDIVTSYFKNFYKYILFYLFTTALLLLPLFYHLVCLGVIKEWGETLVNLSNSFVWLRNTSVLDSIFFKNIPYVGSLRCSEISYSAGIFTTIAAFFGISKMKFSKGVPIIILIFIFLISCNFSAVYFWRIFYYLIIGSEFLNSTSNLSFCALIIFSFGVSLLVNFLQEKKTKKSLILAFFIILLLVVEQISFLKDKNSAWENYSWSKKAFTSELNQIAQKKPLNCEVIDFEYIPLNKEKYGKMDIFYKTEKMKKLESYTGIWLTIVAHTPSINSLNGKSKPLNKSIKGLCKITNPLNFDEL